MCAPISDLPSDISTMVLYCRGEIEGELSTKLDWTFYNVYMDKLVSSVHKTCTAMDPAHFNCTYLDPEE